MRNLSFVLTSVFLACGGHVEHAAAPNPLGDSGVDETSLIDAAVAPARSCAKPRPGADRTCGAGRNDDCCATDVVVGGSFLRFYDHVAYATKDWPATVSSYSLGRYEVTVGRFRSFVESYVDRLDPIESEGVPFVFESFSYVGDVIADRPGGTWKPRASEPQKNALPAENEANTF